MNLYEQPLTQVNEDETIRVLLRNDQLTKKAEKKEQGKRKRTGNGKTGGSKKVEEKKTKKKTKQTQETSEAKETKTEEKKSKRSKGVKKGGEGNKVKTAKKGGGCKGPSRKRRTLMMANARSPSKSTPEDIESAVPPKPKRTKTPKVQVEPTKSIKAREVLKDTLKHQGGPSKSTGPSPKAKAKARGRKPRKSGEDALNNEVLAGELEAFARLFDPKTHSVTDDNFKALLRSKLDVSPECGFRLNIYWSRCACGVTSKEEKKDLHNFSFNGAGAADVHRLAVAVKCGELTAT